MPPRALWRLSWREWQHHPWRHAMALLAVALGVALAWSVHLINASALAEFSAAVRAANGEPDLSLRGPREGFDDALFERVAQAEGVRAASPLLELDTYARGPRGERVALHVVGIDALSIYTMAPQLLPRPADGEGAFATLDPQRVFLNPRARELLDLKPGDKLALRAGPQWIELQVAGDVPAAGAPLAVLDIAGAQAHFGLAGRLTRIDLQLQPGAEAHRVLEALALPPGVQPAVADDAEQRLSTLSRAYRVNLTVLVLAECAALGAAGSLLGLLLGTALAAAALRWLAGDLGGGYFPGIAPALRWDAPTSLGFLLLGTLSALVGGWMPARRAEALSPAQALKGLGDPKPPPSPAWPGLLLLAVGVALAFAPPVGGLPLAAYLSVAALLFGGVALVPAVVQALLAALPASRQALVLLAVQRARFQRHTAGAAVAGVVASLALSVALTVMVTSFRGGVAAWLDQVLPADLYARSAGSSLAADQAWLEPAFVEAVAALPGVQRVAASRVRPLQLLPDRPAVTLIARPLADPARDLPLVGPPLPPIPGETGVYLSEAAATLYAKQPGQLIELPVGRVAGERQAFRVQGVWRDYARQFGTVAMDLAAYRALTGDERINDLALWFAPGADAAQIQAQLRALGDAPGLLEFAATPELRALSLAIFDRSFAVTTYLQAVAIGIGLVGIAASLSAQVLARRKEFGLLAHLGLTRRQIIGVVAGEGAAWLAAGTLLGLGLGLAVSVVLVHVVNPQSFHWTMQLLLPWGPLAALCAAVLAAGIGTAAFAARGAASRGALLSVKEDW